jgi:hypothetical protein
MRGLNIGIGSLHLEGLAYSATEFVGQGAVGGTFSVLNDGKFGAGFLSAGVGSLALPSTGSSFLDFFAHATLGGFASVLGGGKFANGAVTASFAYAATSMSESDEVEVTGDKGSAGSSLTSKQFTLGSSAVFQSPGEAAIAAHSIVDGISIWDNLEYSWGYYQDPTTKLYGYGTISVTGPHGGDYDISFIEGQIRIGMGHTHADYATSDGRPTTKWNDYWDSDHFSSNDSNGERSDMSFMYKGGPDGTWHFFTVGTPSGHDLQWTPKGGVEPLHP